MRRNILVKSIQPRPPEITFKIKRFAVESPTGLRIFARIRSIFAIATLTVP